MQTGVWRSLAFNHATLFTESNLHLIRISSLNPVTTRGFQAIASRFAEQKNTVNPIKPELGASSLFGDVSSHVNQVPVEQGGKATAKEVNFSDRVMSISAGMEGGKGCHCDKSDYSSVLALELHPDWEPSMLWGRPRYEITF